ncbi:hypothetical protein SHJG_7959 [Streptomyces hygroscopicus subsp. jinggangensis 5008]|nr:hypothetical protein SHJG_7959 [Streptomyces hygroscopicus subsp. jinggangensis 5008]AGF67383.1 hypothetical protein SHJGH_7721 [Streptomyces hygroscopicus subsp. jinggangensis TL01]
MNHDGSTAEDRSAGDDSPDSAAPWPDHQQDCAGGCAGRDYRYGSSTNEHPEACTGRPYRFRVWGMRYDSWDVPHPVTLFCTDDEAEAAPYRDMGPEQEVWVEDRDFVLPPSPPAAPAREGDPPF